MKWRLLGTACAALLACAPRATVRPGPPGEVIFLYEGPADRVLLRGSMTTWRAVPLDRRGGAFARALPVPSGRHEFHLEIHHGDRSWLAVPAGAERVSDGLGGENAVLRVP